MSKLQNVGRPALISSFENNKYSVDLMQDNEDAYTIRIKSLIGAGYTAKHSKYNLLNNDGEIIQSKHITLEISEHLINNILKNGETEGFNVYEEAIDTQVIDDIGMRIISPDSIRHKVSNKEQSFTARGEKLNSHWPIFQKYKETGYGSIIRATMTLHQLCSSHCHYCSTIARNKKDSITLEEAKDFVKSLYFDQAEFNKSSFAEYNDLYKKQTGSDIRLKGLILSGGGQPNLWPHFEEFVEWLSSLDIELGLITNGFPKKVPDSVYKNFTWIRLSITPEDASPHYLEGQFNNQYIPEFLKNNSNIAFGLSYVYGAWTDTDILQRINKAISDWNIDYCRMLTDCNLTRSSQLLAHKRLADILFEMGYIDENGNPNGKIFHQLKYHGTPEEAGELWESGQCFLQIYNIFWDTTGHEDNGESFCYTCDSITVLSEESQDKVEVSERRFNSDKWGTVPNTKVDMLFRQKVKSYFNPTESCVACLFMRNNQAVKDLVSIDDYSSIKIDDQIMHVNFP